MNTPSILAYDPAPKHGGRTVPKNSQLPQLAAKRSRSKRSNRVTPGSKEPSVTLEQTSKRFWIKVYMYPNNADVQPILARWRSQKSQAEKLAAAIRLFDAIERGDLDAVQETAPLLPTVLGTNLSKRNRKVDPLIESIDSKESGDQETQQISADLAQAIAEVTVCDLVVNRRAVTGLALRLHSAGYSPQDVRDWYERYWLLHDWRGKKGDRPTLKDVQRLIGHIRTLSQAPGEAMVSAENDLSLHNPSLHREDEKTELEPQTTLEPDPE